MSVNSNVRDVLEGRTKGTPSMPEVERGGRLFLQFRGQEVPLDAEYKHPDPQDPARLSSPIVLALLSSLSGYYEFEDAEDQKAYIREFEEDVSPPDSRIPNLVKRRQLCGPFKSQGSRSTCVAFATTSLLERLNPGLVLSPEAAYYHLSADIPECPFDNYSVRTERAPIVLQEQLVCREQELPYQVLINLEKAISKNNLRPSPDPDHWFGIAPGSVEELNREMVQNTRVLESLLAVGLDIVVALSTKWADTHAAILEPANGALSTVNANHTLLLVGYDRNSRCFFAQNSWDNQIHLKLHYSCAPALFQYGFTVDSLHEVDGEAYLWPPLPSECGP